MTTCDVCGVGVERGQRVGFRGRTMFTCRSADCYLAMCNRLGRIVNATEAEQRIARYTARNRRP